VGTERRAPAARKTVETRARDVDCMLRASARRRGGHARAIDLRDVHD
jgi:hypothetical protein